MSAATEATRFIKTHDGHLIDMTADSGVIVIACNNCHLADVFGARDDDRRNRALARHTERIGAVLMRGEALK